LGLVTSNKTLPIFHSKYWNGYEKTLKRIQLRKLKRGGKKSATFKVQYLFYIYYSNMLH